MNLKNIMLSKGPRYKSICTVQSHSYEIPEEAKLIYSGRKQISNCLLLGVGSRGTIVLRYPCWDGARERILPPALNLPFVLSAANDAGPLPTPLLGCVVLFVGSPAPPFLRFKHTKTQVCATLKMMTKPK